jgi:ubiquinone/menaquinone biosynthesis C-methylase UbiE
MKPIESDAPSIPEPTIWEAAYLRFETPAREVRKFQQRLRRLGAAHWSKDLEIVELFCGRGNGLRALQSLGFNRVEGIDLSPSLASRYDGPGKISVGDCRHLPLRDASRDVLIVQGGLHHLPKLPEDLERTLAEAARVLRPGGRFVAVEPWLTPFLRCAHFACNRAAVRRLVPRIDALATMIENERATYDQWLNAPEVVRAALHRHFAVEREHIGWGKLHFVGRSR